MDSDWKSLQFRVAEKAKDFDAIQKHLVDFFSRDENTLGLFACDGNLKIDLHWILKKIFDHGFCYMAQDLATGEIISVLCAYVQPKVEEVLPFADLKSWPMKVSFGLTTVAVKNSSFWNQIPDNEYLHVFAISTNPKWRGQGLATEVAKGAFFVAKERGHRFVMSLFTSPFSKRIALQMGFKIVKDSNVSYDTLTHNEQLIFPEGTDGRTAKLLYFDMKANHEL